MLLGRGCGEKGKKILGYEALQNVLFPCRILGPCPLCTLDAAITRVPEQYREYIDIMSQEAAMKQADYSSYDWWFHFHWIFF